MRYLRGWSVSFRVDQIELLGMSMSLVVCM